MKFRISFLLTITISMYSAFGTVHGLIPETEKKWTGFLHSPTKVAKTMLNSFSDAELTEVFTEYKQNKSQDELRTLWIIAEKEMRRADRIAADRLFFVFLAVILLTALIFAFIFRIYQMQRRLESEE